MLISRQKRSGRIIAVGGGKGGVGKSFLSTNLALALANKGARVVLVDADLGGANLHTLLGMSAPLVTLSDFISRKATLDQVVVQTPYKNLRLISGALDDLHAANPNYQSKLRLLRHLSAFDTDVMVVDLGAGTALNTLDLFLLADEGLLVASPDPCSIENTYRFLKAAFLRRLHWAAKVLKIKSLLDEARSQQNRRGIHIPVELMQAIIELDPVRGAALEKQMNRFRPHLILNQISFSGNSDDPAIAKDMCSACRRFLGIDLRSLGWIPMEDAARYSTRNRQPLLASDTFESLAASCILSMADRLMLTSKKQLLRAA